ncbi:MAG: quinohemoprotein ethanol dehydrogenase [Limisphaerales bacterium]|jgi:quinohemoprotein ethanol dehydrogenase
MSRLHLNVHVLTRFIGTIAVLLSTSIFTYAETRQISDDDIAEQNNTEDWLAYGRNHNEQRFSPLTQISTKSVAKLGVAWFTDLPGDVGLVSTPLVVDGVMYFTGTMNVIRAVDATNGKLLWSYDPDVAKEVGKAKRVGWVHNRGITMYGDKLFAATWDGRLFALHRETGKLAWSTRTFSLDEPRYITGAPKAFKGKVLIGNGGTEHGQQRGYVTAYDADTGKQVWRFHIVPGNPADGFENDAMKMAAETWTGKWWEHGGGGHAWHAFTYDDELDALYIGTGNGAPWNQRIRSPGGGDNLFLSSVVALDPDTGEYRWHYQTTPGETWDYNSNMDIVLADLDIAGKTVKALMHAPKNGFFYVIDRTNGKLISAEKFADVNWASHVDIATGRPVEIAGARYQQGSRVIMPSPNGAHSWHAMSYSPLTKLVYLPTLHLGFEFDDSNIADDWQGESFKLSLGVEFTIPENPRDYEGSLQAWDPVKQEAVWEVQQKVAMAAGTLVTAGNVVFQGEATGIFTAYNATNGDKLWSYDAGLGISAPPITYELAGKQYLSVLVGFGGGYAAGIQPGTTELGWAYGVHTRRLLTFALDGKVTPPAQPAPYLPEPIFEAGFELDEDLASLGATLYDEHGCSFCHGAEAKAGGMTPDLRASAIPLSEMEPLFASVVRGGNRVGRGMPGYPDLTDEELQALRQYIRQVAHAALDAENPVVE